MNDAGKRPSSAELAKILKILARSPGYKFKCRCCGRGSTIKTVVIVPDGVFRHLLCKGCDQPLEAPLVSDIWPDQQPPREETSEEARTDHQAGEV